MEDTATPVWRAFICLSQWNSVSTSAESDRLRSSYDIMTNEPNQYSRRRLLTAVGAVSVGAFAGGTQLPAQLTAQPQSYTHYTYAEVPEDGPRLRVAWASTYNGRLTNASDNAMSLDGSAGEEQESTGGAVYVDSYDSDIHGPLVVEENVLPGDSGTISIGLVAEAMDARIRCQITDGDGGEQFGSLAAFLSAGLWYDTGLFGIGDCTGATGMPADADFHGTLGTLGERFGPDGTEELWLGRSGRPCLSEGEQLCLGFAWELPNGVPNELQRESTSFGLSFQAEQCGGLL